MESNISLISSNMLGQTDDLEYPNYEYGFIIIDTNYIPDYLKVSNVIENYDSENIKQELNILLNSLSQEKLRNNMFYSYWKHTRLLEDIEYDLETKRFIIADINNILADTTKSVLNNNVMKHIYKRYFFNYYLNIIGKETWFCTSVFHPTNNLIKMILDNYKISEFDNNAIISKFYPKHIFLESRRVIEILSQFNPESKLEIFLVKQIVTALKDTNKELVLILEE